MKKIYLIGSLRNPEIPKIANKIRELGFEVFDDWFAAGPEADDKWRDYEKQRGRTYKEALEGYAANHVFHFDKKHLEESDIAILYLPAGKSGHLEEGWVLGFTAGIRHIFRKFFERMAGIDPENEIKRAYILLDNPERWDVMYKFADGVFNNFEELAQELEKIKKS